MEEVEMLEVLRLGMTAAVNKEMYQHQNAGSVGVGCSKSVTFSEVTKYNKG